MSVSVQKWGWGEDAESLAFWGWLESLAVKSDISLQYGDTTVTLTGYGVKGITLKLADLIEHYKSMTGRTVAVYGAGPQKKVHLLMMDLLPKAKMDELHALWVLTKGPGKGMTYTDTYGDEHNVRWTDDYFPLSQVSLNAAQGGITLEEA